MYPGPNHMRDRHGNNPDVRPDQRMSLNSNLEPRRDARRDPDFREKQRQEARAMREKTNFPHATAVVPESLSPAMFTLVRRQQPQPDNRIVKVLGSFASFAGSDQNLDLMGVDQQPGTPAPATDHHDAHLQRQASHTDIRQQAHRQSNVTPTSRGPPPSSSSRPPPSQLLTTTIPVKSQVNKFPSRPPSSTNNESKTASSKPTLIIDDRKLAMIFDEMADLRTPMSALRETPRHENQTVFQFPTPPKKDTRMGKTPTKPQSSAQALESYHCDLSDDSDAEPDISSLDTNSGHVNGILRQVSTTSQNTDDSSNSEDSSCSDSEDSSSNSSEEDKPNRPEPSQLPPSPGAADPIAMSWSLEKIFKQQNGNVAKDEVYREQEMMHKPYDGQYDALSRSPHRTDLAPPVITKEPVGRTRRLTDSSDESILDSSYKRRDSLDTITKKYVNNVPKSPSLSESELETDSLPVTKHKIPTTQIRKELKSPYKDRVTRNSKSSSLPNKSSSSSSKYSKEKSSKKSHSTKERNSKKSFKTMQMIHSDVESDSDHSKEIVKISQEAKKSSHNKSSNSSRKSTTRSVEKTERSSRHAKLTEMSPPVSQEAKHIKMADVSSPPVSNEPSISSRPSERKRSYSKRGHHHKDAKPQITEDSSRKSNHEDRSSKSSPPYCHSARLRLQVPKLRVYCGETPSVVLSIPVVLVSKVPSDNASPVKAKVSKEVIEMRTSPSNEDAKKLRAIFSIYKGSKKRPSSQEPDRNRKSPKLEESNPIKHDIKLNIKKDKPGSRTSTPQPEVIHRHSSSRHKSAKETESVSKVREKTKEKEKYPQPKEEKKRKRKLSEEVELPKKRAKAEMVAATSHEPAEHKSRSEKKEAYRSYVKDSSSPVERSSSRAKESSRPSSRNANINVDIHEFSNVERSSDDDACFRTPQQVQSYGYKENNSKRQKVEGNQQDRATSKVTYPTANTSSSEVQKSASDLFNCTSATQVPPNLSYFSYLEKRHPIVATDHMQYLLKAKELKHLADKESNRVLQVMIYLESGLYFILTGESMEQESTNVSASFSMYNDTLKFIRHVSSIIVRKDSFKEDPSHNNLNLKLAVLSLRCQSLLYLKLYTMHAGEANEVQRDLAEYFKAASKSPTVPIAWTSGGQVMAGAGSTTTVIGGRMSNSPSSLSPTPSPAGSVGSEGSQSSSGYGTEGASQRAVAGVMSATPPMVQTSTGHLVPKHTFVSLQRHLSIANFLVAAHHNWKESDTYIYEYNTKDFFIAMDHELGPLTLHSTPSELVMYVQKSLDKLKGQLSLGSSSRSSSSLS